MGINKQFTNVSTGSYDQAGASWTQPEAVSVLPGMDFITWQLQTACTDYNGATITTTLQGSVDGTNWTDITPANRGADAVATVPYDGNDQINVGAYSSVRFFHALTGGPPNADVTVTSTLYASYTD